MPSLFVVVWHLEIIRIIAFSFSNRSAFSVDLHPRRVRPWISRWWWQWRRCCWRLFCWSSYWWWLWGGDEYTMSVSGLSLSLPDCLIVCCLFACLSAYSHLHNADGPGFLFINPPSLVITLMCACDCIPLPVRLSQIWVYWPEGAAKC